MKKIFTILIFLLSFVCVFKFVNAQTNSIVISEIAWMGTTSSSSDEWIELYNSSSQDIDLNGWSLSAVDGSPNIELNGVIYANDYFLLERTDDESVLGVVADLVYSGSLNNGGEFLQLINNLGEVVDGVDAGGGWEFGDNTTKQTMEKVGGSWQTSLNVGGTPKVANSSGVENDIPGQDIVNNLDQNIAGVVVINEIVSDPIDGENEWIELFSNYTEDINLDGWYIEDGTTNKILDLQGVLAPAGFVVFELTSNRLNNGGDVVILKDNNNNIIDQVAYGDWDDGNIDDNAPKAEDGSSVGRFQNSSSFEICSIPTKGSSNNFDNSQSNDSESLLNNNQEYYAGIIGSVVISELVMDPEDGPEWIELYNKTDNNLILDGWHIEDGTESKTNIKGELQASSYLIIENIKGNLNNKGDIVILYDGLSNIIDKVSYGNWDDGNINDNAPKAQDPYSLARVGNNQDTNNDLEDFKVVETPTKGSDNILLFGNNTEEDEAVRSNLYKKIIISEIFPNPVGSDESEFIELQNISEQTVNLKGITIKDNSKRVYKIDEEVKLNVNEFYIISRAQSKIALNNTGGDAVYVYDEQNKLVDQVSYSNKAEEGKSYSLLSGVWEWTDTQTKGEENILVKENQAPVVVLDIEKSEFKIGEEVIIDSSDSYDPEGNNLIREWRVENELFHGVLLKKIFNERGSYEIKLVVSDGEIKTVENIFISVAGNTSEPALFSQMNYDLINEFLPNPIGSDDQEFIELYNINGENIDLSGFYIDDEEGGSRPFQISDQTIISPHGYYILNREQTGLALNNDGDSVRFFDKDRNILQQIDYGKSSEGFSYSKDEQGGWFWTDITTKGEKNIMEVSNDNYTQEVYDGIIKTELSQVRNLVLGQKVKVEGVVVVEPGILGTQIFYINSSDLSSGIQIYNYKKNFPNLKIGDHVQIEGALSQSRGEHRIKTSSADDIFIKTKKNETIRPLKIKIENIEKELEGALVEIGGQIIEINGQNIYLDDGSDEVKIYIKKSTDISKKNIKEGSVANIVGIISQTTTGYRILPRNQNDIDVVKVLGDELEINYDNDDNDDNVVIETRNEDWLKYLTAILGAMVLVLLIINARTFMKKL